MQLTIGLRDAFSAGKFNHGRMRPHSLRKANKSDGMNGLQWAVQMRLQPKVYVQ